MRESHILDGMAGMNSPLIQWDPNYGGIVVGPRNQPPRCSSGGSWSAASERSLDSCPPAYDYVETETPGQCAPSQYSIEEPAPQDLGATENYTPNNSLIQKEPQGIDKDTPGDRAPLRHGHQDFACAGARESDLWRVLQVLQELG